MVVLPQMIKNENDVYISLFGGFGITTYRGKLTDEIEAMMINIRSLVCRIRRMSNLIADINLIITDDGEHRLNPELNIMTDMEMFDCLRVDASVTANE